MSDDLVCSGCGRLLVIYMDTLVCPVCDPVTVADLTWQKKYIEENQK